MWRGGPSCSTSTGTRGAPPERAFAPRTARRGAVPDGAAPAEARETSRMRARIFSSRAASRSLTRSCSSPWTSELVAVVHDRPYGVGVVLGDPGRNEEGGPHRGLAQQLQDAGQCVQHAEAALGERDRLRHATRHPQGLGVEVEGERARGARTFRPEDGHGPAVDWSRGARRGPPDVNESPNAKYPLSSRFQADADPTGGFGAVQPERPKAPVESTVSHVRANGSMNAGS